MLRLKFIIIRKKEESSGKKKNPELKKRLNGCDYVKDEWSDSDDANHRHW